MVFLNFHLNLRLQLPKSFFCLVLVHLSLFSNAIGVALTKVYVCVAGCASLRFVICIKLEDKACEDPFPNLLESLSRGLESSMIDKVSERAKVKLPAAKKTDRPDCLEVWRLHLGLAGHRGEQTDGLIEGDKDVADIDAI